LHRESSADVHFRSHATASKIGWINTAEEHANVYNLEVEDDHSYNAGGFFVHNCHPNCRSEILPLMPLNPKHKKLIDNESMWRQNNSPVPLIKGWNE
jgi:hypothetical protein